MAQDSASARETIQVDDTPSKWKLLFAAALDGLLCFLLTAVFFAFAGSATMDATPASRDYQSARAEYNDYFFSTGVIESNGKNGFRNPIDAWRGYIHSLALATYYYEELPYTNESGNSATIAPSEIYDAKDANGSFHFDKYANFYFRFLPSSDLPDTYKNAYAGKEANVFAYYYLDELDLDGIEEAIVPGALSNIEAPLVGKAILTEEAAKSLVAFERGKEGEDLGSKVYSHLLERLNAMHGEILTEISTESATFAALFAKTNAAYNTFYSVELALLLSFYLIIAALLFLLVPFLTTSGETLGMLMTRLRYEDEAGEVPSWKERLAKFPLDLLSFFVFAPLSAIISINVIYRNLSVANIALSLVIVLFSLIALIVNLILLIAGDRPETLATKLLNLRLTEK